MKKFSISVMSDTFYRVKSFSTEISLRTENHVALVCMASRHLLIDGSYKLQAILP
jgi:hypothetical protein